jgi:hypothetical protein
MINLLQEIIASLVIAIFMFMVGTVIMMILTMFIDVWFPHFHLINYIRGLF